jgi:pilus assembly protein CpaB
MKNRRAILFLTLSAMCGLLTAFAAPSLLQSPAPVGEEKVPIVVAGGPAPIGSEAQNAVPSIARWPADVIPAGAFRDPSLLQGRVLARSVVKGEAILESALLPPGAAAGLDSLIDESARAVSVQVDPFIGVAGFVQPGSQVDVLSTFTPVSSGESSATSVTRAVLQNVRVLAVDTRLERNGQATQEMQVVTLQVSPEEAQVLAHAETEGPIKLALRNPKDEGQSRPAQLVLGTTVHDVRF